MAFTIPYDTLSDVVDKSEIEDNFSTIVAHLNGGLTNESISARAAIASSKVVQPTAEDDLRASFQVSQIIPSTSLALLNTTVGAYLAGAHVPYYTLGVQLDSIYIACPDLGGGDAAIEAVVGYWTNTSWTTTSTITLGDIESTTDRNWSASGTAIPSSGIGTSIPMVYLKVKTAGSGYGTNASEPAIVTFTFSLIDS
jgi:hypothetical protein